MVMLHLWPLWHVAYSFCLKFRNPRIVHFPVVSCSADVRTVSHSFFKIHWRFIACHVMHCHIYSFPYFCRCTRMTVPPSILKDEVQGNGFTDIIYITTIVTSIGLRIFLLAISGISLWHLKKLFISLNGISHRLFGAFYLTWLLIGAFLLLSSRNMSDDAPEDLSVEFPSRFFWYNVVLGLLGLGVTLTAANDFPHRHVKNAPGQSGTLHAKAIVTQSEMIEHSFYQGLNLLQAIYLYTLSQCEHDKMYSSHSNDPWIDWRSLSWRLFLLSLVTSPWLFRQKFPVHSFSQNWKQTSASTRNHPYDNNMLEIVLYRIKKAQYLFYKHVILHGINIWVAIIPMANINNNSIANLIPNSISWCVFWLLLNTSYVMEFFLQSLVKRKVLSQSIMLLYQRWLMTMASISAVTVLVQILLFHDGATGILIRGLFPLICGTSLMLNFVHRHADMWNTLLVAIVACLLVLPTLGQSV